MKKSLIYFLPVTMFFLACSSVDKEQTEKDIAAVREQLEEYTRLSNQENTIALLDFYTDDAEVIKPDETRLTGKEAIQVWLQDQFEAYAVEINNTSKAVVVIDDKAYDRGIYVKRMNSEFSEKKRIQSGWYLYIWQKVPDGSWKIVKQSWTAPPLTVKDEEIPS